MLLLPVVGCVPEVSHPRFRGNTILQVMEISPIVSELSYPKVRLPQAAFNKLKRLTRRQHQPGRSRQLNQAFKSVHTQTPPSTRRHPRM